MRRYYSTLTVACALMAMLGLAAAPAMAGTCVQPIGGKSPVSCLPPPPPPPPPSCPAYVATWISQLQNQNNPGCKPMESTLWNWGVTVWENGGPAPSWDPASLWYQYLLAGCAAQYPGSGTNCVITSGYRPDPGQNYCYNTNIGYAADVNGNYQCGKL